MHQKRRLTDSRLANRGAAIIRASFEMFQTHFRIITRRAKSRFEARDWRGSRDDGMARLEVYRAAVDHALEDVRELMEERARDLFIWVSMKAVYSGMIEGRPDWELAETFFNSIARRVFATVGVDPRIEFVDSDFETPEASIHSGAFRVWRKPLDELSAILTSYGIDAPFDDLERDVTLIRERIVARLAEVGMGERQVRVEMLESAFYRGHGAYLVGRLMSPRALIPFVLALRHRDEGVFVDAVLLDENSVSTLFSFTRAYFRVEVARPYELVQFLKTLLPLKRPAELYISIGYNRHGKTELYRNIIHHIESTNEQFIFASGTPGMVMVVFTINSLDMVFKVIRDRFPPPKNTCLRAIKEKYELVFKHDRAGRLIDAQQFEHLTFPRERFDEALLEDLLSTSSKMVSVEGDRVIISHAYVERRISPLNLYLSDAEPAAARAAIIDFGNAIKDLAAANIFPGDMLLKNFGVTRQGRVVFYDYDELSLLETCRFRRIPHSDRYEDEISAQPWFSVSEGDVFPEEFEHLFGIPDGFREPFEVHHRDLYGVGFWRDTQASLRAGEVIDILPYRPEKRLHARLPEQTGIYRAIPASA